MPQEAPPKTHDYQTQLNPTNIMAKQHIWFPYVQNSKPADTERKTRHSTLQDSFWRNTADVIETDRPYVPLMRNRTYFITQFTIAKSRNMFLAKGSTLQSKRVILRHLNPQ